MTKALIQTVDDAPGFYLVTVFTWHMQQGGMQAGQIMRQYAARNGLGKIQRVATQAFQEEEMIDVLYEVQIE